MTRAATRFLEAVSQSWDSIDPWQQTAYLGLSEYDQEALLDLCEPDDDIAQVYAEVMEAIKAKVQFK